MKKTLIFLAFILLGVALVTTLNFFFIEPIIIPDPCYYHTNKTTKLFDVFYTISSSEGFHPFPSTFNFALTLIIGILGGCLGYNYYTK